MKVTIEKVDKLVERADVGYEVAKEALEASNGDMLDAVILLEREGKLGPNAGKSKTVVTGTGSSMSPMVIGQSFGDGGVPQTRVEPNFTPGKPPRKSRKERKAEKAAGRASGYGPAPGYGPAKGSGPASGYGPAQGSGPAPGYGPAQGSGPAPEYGAYQGRTYQQQSGAQKYADETGQFEEGAKSFFGTLGRIIRGSVVNYFVVWRKGERVLYFPVILFLFCLIHWVFWIVLILLLVGLFCGCSYRFSGPHLGRKSVNEAMGKASEMADEINNGADSAEETGE